MIIDFRKDEPKLEPVTINGSSVTQTTTYDYLGTTLAKNLTWSDNIQRLANKATKRLYHLRKLREFRVSVKTQVLFYESVIQSVLVFGVAVWGGGLTQKDVKVIRRVVRTAQRIVGAPLSPWEEVYGARLNSLAMKIVQDKHHPLNASLEPLPSGRRYRQIRFRTNRLKNSMVPKAICALNKNK